MKKIIFLFIPLLMAISCQQKKAEEAVAQLEGQISNLDSDFILISSMANPDMTDTVFVDEQGFFHFKKKLEVPSYFTFSYGDNTLTIFLEAGNNLTLNFDAQDPETTVEFTGKGSAANNYLNDMAGLRKELQQSTQELFSLSEDEFIVRLDSIKQLKLNLFENSFTEETEISKVFLKNEKAKILYAKANMMILYPRYHAYFSKNDSFEVSDNFNSYLDELNLNDPGLLSIGEYKRFLQSYLQQQGSDIYDQDTNLQNDDNGWVLARFDAVDASFDNNEVKEQLAFNILSDQVRYQGVRDIDKLLEIFKGYSSNDSLLNILNNHIAEWESIAAGKPAPVFTYPDIDSNMHSLNDFAGKYVYIDVWATWCGPCRAEIPSLKKLEEEFKDKNIQFISISIDENKDDWIKMETREELGGLQLYAGGWDSEIAVKYLVHSIPRFILIDTDGNILDNNAPRPSGHIAEVLNSLENI